MLPPWIDWTSFRLFLSIVCCTDIVLVFIVVCFAFGPRGSVPPLCG